MVAAHLYLENKIYSNWCRIDVFFLVGFLIVHFQWPVMYSFSNIVPENISRIWIDSKYVNYGTWVSTLGGLSWLLGYSIPQKTKRKNSKNVKYNYSKLLYFTALLFILFIVTAGKVFLTNAKYIEGPTSDSGGIAAYINILLSICLTVLTVFVVLDNKNKYKNNLLKWILGLNKLYLIIVMAYVIIFLAAGERGAPISLILTLLILIGCIIRPIALKEFLIFTILGAFFMTMISIGRGIDSEKNIFNSGYENIEVNSGYDFTLELANSVRTLYMSISEVPGNYDYFLGELWIGSLLSIIPFAQSIYFQMTGLGNEYLGSAELITFFTFGHYPHMGEGTSLIADIYLNFGVIGAVFIMFLFGKFAKLVNIKAFLEQDLTWIIIAAIIGGFSVYLGRSSLFIILRPIIWSFPIIYFLIKKRQVLR
tara:strand:+ start:2444 stop:3712 length:1269 start_codon:yes stop_codon:yes gene_type:complete